MSKSQRETSGGADSRNMVCGGVLEHGEGFVLLQAFRKMLRALWSELVGRQTANGSRNKTSTGADGRKMACSGVRECLQGGVGLQCLRNVHCALCTDGVVPQTANRS